MQGEPAPWCRSFSEPFVRAGDEPWIRPVEHGGQWRRACARAAPPIDEVMKRLPKGSMRWMAAVWLGAVLGGMVALLRYASSPGSAASVPHRWPVESRIAFDSGRPNLILFAHPRCPCTRATLGELEALLARCQVKPRAQVWFIMPADAGEDWNDTDLWRRASSIPGVTVGCDEHLEEARRFGAETSGQALLYDGAGNLLFRGGITVARGHAGENAGRHAVEALLESSLAPGVRHPVFGCPLVGPALRRKGGLACKP